MAVLDKQSIPLISIAIVTYNRSAEVVQAIQSVYDQDYPNFEVVVADNYSADNTVELIENRFPNTKVIRLHCNLGACGGRNVALANCRGEVIFNLDDDAVLKSDTLTLIMEFFATALPEVGLVACQIFENGSYRFPKQSVYTAIFEGCGWAIRRSVLEQVGYFSDRLVRAAEEADFALTYLAAGYRMWYLSEAVIHHMPSAVRVSEKISFYKCRNEILIIFERYPAFLILPFVVWTIVSQSGFGIRNPSHLPYIIDGVFRAMLKAPGCLFARRPVPFSVVRRVRFSPMYKSKLAFLAGQP
jgi:GT2 family glycosyltransferase